MKRKFWKLIIPAAILLAMLIAVTANALQPAPPHLKFGSFEDALLESDCVVVAELVETGANVTVPEEDGTVAVYATSRWRVTEAVKDDVTGGRNRIIEVRSLLSVTSPRRSLQCWSLPTPVWQGLDRAVLCLDIDPTNRFFLLSDPYLSLLRFEADGSLSCAALPDAAYFSDLDALHAYLAEEAAPNYYTLLDRYLITLGE